MHIDLDRVGCVEDENPESQFSSRQECLRGFFRYLKAGTAISKTSIIDTMFNKGDSTVLYESIILHRVIMVISLKDLNKTALIL
jgi:hypothetical protein